MSSCETIKGSALASFVIDITAKVGLDSLCKAYCNTLSPNPPKVSISLAGSRWNVYQTEADDRFRK